MERGIKPGLEFDSEKELSRFLEKEEKRTKQVFVKRGTIRLENRKVDLDIKIPEKLVYFKLRLKCKYGGHCKPRGVGSRKTRYESHYLQKGFFPLIMKSFF